MTHLFGTVVLLGFSLVVAEAAPDPAKVARESFPKGAKAQLGSLLYRGPYSIRPPAMSPDGRWIALSPDGGGNYLLLSASTGRVERELKTTGNALELVGFSADSNRLAAWGTGPRASGVEFRVWDVSTGKEVGAENLLHSINRGVSRESVSLSADGTRVAGVVHAGNARLAIVCEVATGRELVSVELLANQAGYLALSPDGKRLATWGNYSVQDGRGGYKETNEAGEAPNQIVQVWDVATGKETARIRPRSFYARRAAFSPDGGLLVTGGDPMELWEVASGKRIRTLVARKYSGKAVAFSPDGNTVAGVGSRGWIELWEVKSGLRTAMCQCTGGTPIGVVFPRGEQPLAFGRDGQAVLVWQLPNGRLLTPAEGHTAPVTAVAFSPDGRSLISVGADDRLLRWDAATGKQVGRIALDNSQDRQVWPGREMRSAVLFPRGERLATFRDGVTVYDLATGHEQFTLGRGTGSGGLRSPVSLSPDGSRIASFGQRGKDGASQTAVVVWDTATGAVLLEKPLASKSLVSIAFTGDSKRLVACAGKPGLNLTLDKLEVAAWDVKSGKPLARAEFPTGKYALRLSNGPDEKSVVIDTGFRDLQVWDVMTGKERLSYLGVFPSGELSGSVVPVGAPPTASPDGRFLAVGCHSRLAAGEHLPRDGIVRVIDLATGKVVTEFSGHRSVVTALAFSPDGKTLASGSADTTMLLWDLTKLAGK